MEMYNLMGDPSLWIPEPGGGADMPVMPTGGLQTEGMAGGPFDPNSQVYVLGKQTTTRPSRTTSRPPPTWVTITNGSGSIPVDGSVDVPVAINSEAETFGQGHYEALGGVRQRNHPRR